MPTSISDNRLSSSTRDDVDRWWMIRAIKIAHKGEGRVEPNPMVGCVITRGGRALGEGYHRRFGLAHAEIEALRSCPTSPRGATVYVSLEPCCHHGKTPPCADALIQAGVRRVVVAARDPSPRVNGRGIRRLRAAGIEVVTGVCTREAAELLAPFAVHAVQGRPYVIAKWAQSLDGKLATARGRSQWISCERSRRAVHRLRGRVDAILVGSGTVLADDPVLTARDVPLRRQAMRVVLDRRLRIPERCQLVRSCGTMPTLVFTSQRGASSPKARRLARRGVEVVGLPQRTARRRDESDGRGSSLDPWLGACLAVLASRDVTNLLVEGGPTVLTALFRAGLVDEAIVYTAPILIGGARAPSVIVGDGSSRVETAIRPISAETRRSGTDMVCRMRFTDPLRMLRGGGRPGH